MESTLKKILNEIRTFLIFKLRYRYVKRGKNVHIQWSAKMWSPHRDITLGNNVGIGHYCILGSDIRIGNDVMIGDHAGLICSDDHTYGVCGKTMWNSPRGDKERIEIEDDVWIGHGSIILSGVTIGRGAIVGAGSVVVKDVQPYSIVAGVPAKLVRMRFTEEEIKTHEIMLGRTIPACEAADKVIITSHATLPKKSE